MKNINKKIKFIDLFAGMGGFRLGFENSCKKLKLESECVFTSEIKKHALEVYTSNFENKNIYGDITQIDAKDIPKFDVLLAGFPCQAFSSAGKRDGFNDTRGTLFFEIERILEYHKPKCFILENVEGLVTHDKINNSDKLGRTISIILEKLENLNYKVSWKVLNARDFGLAQSRKRIYIVGNKKTKISLDNFPLFHRPLSDFLESGGEATPLKITSLLFENFKPSKLYGKAIKDTRGGKDNIHSWDISLKGEVNLNQKILLEKILRHRRYKKWAELKGITWMDGMPLTYNEIRSFCQIDDLKRLLDDLVKKGYLSLEHPKDLKIIRENGKSKKIRAYREDLEKGYNIVAGNLSFEINKILDPKSYTPTLVATDINKLMVLDGKNIRRLSLKEQLRLFGFPDNFKVNIKESLAHDLFGNTIPVKVVTAISNRLLSQVFLDTEFTEKKIDNINQLQKSLFI